MELEALEAGIGVASTGIDKAPWVGHQPHSAGLLARLYCRNHGDGKETAPTMDVNRTMGLSDHDREWSSGHQSHAKERLEAGEG